MDEITIKNKKMNLWIFMVFALWYRRVDFFSLSTVRDKFQNWMFESTWEVRLTCEVRLGQ